MSGEKAAGAERFSRSSEIEDARFMAGDRLWPVKVTYNGVSDAYRLGIPPYVQTLMQLHRNPYVLVVVIEDGIEAWSHARVKRLHNKTPEELLI